MFSMPQLGRNDVTVTKIDNFDKSVLNSEKIRIHFNDGEWIEIIYKSIDMDRTFQSNPEMSIVEVTCSNPSLNFKDGWDEQ